MRWWAGSLVFERDLYRNILPNFDTLLLLSVAYLSCQCRIQMFFGIRFLDVKDWIV